MSRWPNFTATELNCQHCGMKNTHPDWLDFMDKVQKLRNICYYKYSFGLPISSGYRCENHPIELAKDTPGEHNHAAVDIQVSGRTAYLVQREAYALGFAGIGVNQKGPENKRFIHLDDRPYTMTWSY